MMLCDTTATEAGGGLSSEPLSQTTTRRTTSPLQNNQRTLPPRWGPTRTTTNSTSATTRQQRNHATQPRRAGPDNNNERQLTWTTAEEDEDMDGLVDRSARRRWSSAPSLGGPGGHHKKWLRQQSGQLHQCFTSIVDLSTTTDYVDNDQEDIHENAAAGDVHSGTDGKQQQQQQQQYQLDGSTIPANNKVVAVGDRCIGGLVDDDYTYNPRRWSGPASYDHQFLRRQSEALRRESQCLHQILMSVQDLSAAFLEDEEEGAGELDDENISSHNTGVRTGPIVYRIPVVKEEEDESLSETEDEDTPPRTKSTRMDAYEDRQHRDPDHHLHSRPRIGPLGPSPDGIGLDTTHNNSAAAALAPPEDSTTAAPPTDSFYDAMVLRYHHAELNEICTYLDMTTGITDDHPGSGGIVTRQQTMA